MPFRLAGRGLDGRYVLLVTTDKGELAVSLRAGIEDSTWVASRPLAADVRLGADDMKREIRTMWGPGSRDDREAPLGWETRRAVRPGERLAGSAIAPPSLVAPGEMVRFEWNAGTISIVREGVAIGRGRLGETIQGRDKNGGERLTGIVIGPGRARLERGEIR
jgi:flagella basal body P-ring formation protein FlgA